MAALKQHIFLILRICFDIVLIPFIFILSYSLKFKVGWVFQKIFLLPFGEVYEQAQVEPYINGMVYILFIWMTSFYLSGVYRHFSGIMPEVDELTKLAKGISFATLIVAAVTFIYPIIPSSRFVVFYSWILGILILSLVRLLLYRLELSALSKGHNTKNTLVVGAESLGQEIVEKITQYPSFRYRYVGTLSAKQPSQLRFYIKNLFLHLGKIEEFEQYCIQKNVEVVFVTQNLRQASYFNEMVLFCDANNIELNIVSDFSTYLAGSNEVINFDGLPFISHYCKTRFGFSKTKRCMDIVGALILMFLCCPLFVCICCLIKLVSPSGPIFYIQERVGYLGHTFRLVKFRTMGVDAEKMGPKMVDTKEETRYIIGGKWLRRYSLDELPQLLNILKGEMSLVGPRPERPYFVKKFEQSVPFYHLRHHCPVGLTGWAQINGRSFLTDKPDQKLKYDLYYLKNRTLVFDFKILLKTILVVFKAEEAY